MRTESEQGAFIVGQQDFRRGAAKSANPYCWPDPCDRAKRLERAWLAGWDEARSDDWNAYPVNGRRIA